MKNIPKMFSLKQNLLILLSITLLSIGMHWQKLDKDLIGIHAWRQTQTGWNIRNFYRNDFNILNPRTNKPQEDGLPGLYRYEFPAMQWSVAAVQRVLGTEDILTVRLSMFLIGIASIWGMFMLLRNVFKEDLIAWFGAFAYCFSPLFYYYTINPLPDNLALCAGIWFLNFFQKYVLWRKNSHLILSSFFLSLSVASKLPFIVLAGGIPVFLLQQKSGKEWLKFIVIFAAFLVPTIVWYLWVIPGWGGNGIVKGILDNQIPWERTQEILLYHYHTMFPEVLMSNVITYLFLLGVAVLLLSGKWKQKRFYLYFFPALFCLLYLLFELNQITNIHDYYMMPFLPPLYLVVTFGIRSLYRFGLLGRVLTLFLLICMPFRAFHATKDWWSIEKSYTNGVVFTHQEELKNAVPKGAVCIFGNDMSSYVYSYKVDRLGTSFYYDDLDKDKTEEHIRKGVHYIYSDSKKVNEMLDSCGFIDTLLYQVGTMNVYRLKMPESK